MNVRQREPAERRALEQLRAGDIDQAVDWYRANGRILVGGDRAETIVVAADRWAAEVDAGAETSLFAFQRWNVAALNQAARERMIAAGRVDRSREVAGYAPGDWVVTLAPNYEGELVTSQRGFVVDTTAADRSITVVMEDGRARG